MRVVRVCMCRSGGSAQLACGHKVVPSGGGQTGEVGLARSLKAISLVVWAKLGLNMEHSGLSPLWRQDHGSESAAGACAVFAQ